MRSILLLLLVAGWIGAAQAATELVEVAHLPLAEAQAAVQSQLSPQGRVSLLPSRNMLIIEDDADSIRRARELLSRLDQPLPQYRTRVEIVRRQQLSQHQLSAGVSLPGGWVRLSAVGMSLNSGSRSIYQLAVQANRPGHIEAGEIVPMRASVRSWLAGYGIADAATYVPVTGGFDVVVQPAGDGKARVRILPWLKQLRQQQPAGGIDVRVGKGGEAHDRNRVRLRGFQPGQAEGERIDVVAANTELVVPLGEEVMIAAAGQEAQMMGQALLSGHSQVGDQQLLISLRIDTLR